MKSYLDLVSISQKVHRKQSFMVRLCIILSVFLITAIFGMADMEIRSQNAQAKWNYGEWHAAFRSVADEDGLLIGQRPRVAAYTRYDTLNYRLSMHYQVDGKEAVIIGFDESALDIFPTAELTEGSFPGEGGVVIDENMKERLSLSLGDEILLTAPDGLETPYRISGVFGQFPMLAKSDAYGLALNTEEFRKLSLEGAQDNYDSMIYVKFSSWCRIQKEIKAIQEQFGISDDRVGRNELLLATLGQSADVSMLAIYGVALILAVLVAIAGSLMISSSLNSNLAQRTTFFGMLRCLGASEEQVTCFVRREALSWCLGAVPTGALSGTILVWILSAVLRLLSPKYFAKMPAFGISLIGLAAGSVIGTFTVYLASGRPAKNAAKVSPLTAVSGNASGGTAVKRAANTRLYRIETALGIHHAMGSRKNFLLMSCSFAFSIILFLSFSAAVDFTHYAVTPLMPYAPDLSIVSPDNTCSLDHAWKEEFGSMEGVKRVYGRSFAYDVPVETDLGKKQAYLISYEQYQFAWAGDSLITGSISEVERGEGVLAVYHENGSLKEGESVTVHCGEGERQLAVKGILSDCPFHPMDGQEILICSEETFKELTGREDYTVLDIQLDRNADDAVVEKIRAVVGENVTFSDSRLGNAEVKGAMYSFALFVYGFLAVIALISAFNIMNSIAMSVSARIRQYGIMRGVGMSSAQLLKMVAAEAVTYGVFGMLIGCMAGIPLNWLFFDQMITLRWGAEWKFPAIPLCIIVIVMACSLLFAIYGPAKRIRKMSVVDTILR